MRVVVVGTGSIGTAIAVLLHRTGIYVVAATRPVHVVRLRRRGLRVDLPAGSVEAPGRLVHSLSRVQLHQRDLVLLTLQSQDTAAVLSELADRRPDGAAFVCLQNGTANEDLVARERGAAWSGLVLVPATYSGPGHSTVHADAPIGIIDVGLHPEGEDERSVDLAAALRSTGHFESLALSDVAAWKCAKFVLNQQRR